MIAINFKNDYKFKILWKKKIRFELYEWLWIKMPPLMLILIFGNDNKRETISIKPSFAAKIKGVLSNVWF